MSDELQGLAAIARRAKDPAITVTSLRAAVADGSLPHEIGVGGRTLVRFSDVQALGAKTSQQPEAPAPVAAKKTGVKLPRRKGRSA